MPNITTCTTCGGLYEAGSEEQANEPTRFCQTCRPKLKTKQYPPEINDHKEEWCALTYDDKFAGHGKTPGLCIEDAARNGHPKDTITLLWVPDVWPQIPTVFLSPPGESR